MIQRIVKMTFRDNEIENFKLLFNEVYDKIRKCKGCRSVTLLQDVENRNIFFTYSVWEGLDDLNAYRNSELFADTWKKTKAMFLEKAEAWSTEII
ncbi:MAG: antibiotic biosynthesis monooxygenase [Flavobacteriales bacterium]|nr:antibiotic biosynthesis monooxygenase [Flavobacteriales bacterium]